MIDSPWTAFRGSRIILNQFTPPKFEPGEPLTLRHLGYNSQLSSSSMKSKPHHSWSMDSLQSKDELI